MKDKKRKLSIILTVAFVIATIWSFVFMLNERTEAAYAQEDMKRCDYISSQLQSLQNKPKLASDHEQLFTETTGLIERAAREANIPAGAIERITPRQAKKISDTCYKEKPTSVILKNITLKQLVTVAKSLSNSEDNLTIKSIKLTSPNDKATGDTWDVELVLSYLIYDLEADK